jgi:RNA polymerase sigma-70 factor (ECF subfamily)
MEAQDERAARDAVAATYRTEGRRVFATLLRLIGDFDLAEEALHDAFAAALEQWPREGVPERPRPWLISAGRFRALDTLRRRVRFDDALAAWAERRPSVSPSQEEDEVGDDRLRLILACGHPSLSPEAQTALTLREVCGLTTEEIARAFLTAPATVAQRIVRAKATLREHGVPGEPPPREELSGRLAAVLRTIYLVFNEGWSASSGDAPIRTDLVAEAVRLARVTAEALPEPEPEADGLLALLLLLDARRAARTTAAGELVLLDDQDRRRWDRGLIAEGCALVERALRSRRFGPYTLQAAIAAVHAEAREAAATDWPQIVGLYDLLWRATPTPVVALNRAIAVGMRDGPQEGLARIEALLASGALADYVPAHAARADFADRLGRRDAARDAWSTALARSRQEAERRYFARRLRDLAPP